MDAPDNSLPSLNAQIIKIYQTQTKNIKSLSEADKKAALQIKEFLKNVHFLSLDQLNQLIKTGRIFGTKSQKTIIDFVYNETKGAIQTANKLYGESTEITESNKKEFDKLIIKILENSCQDELLSAIMVASPDTRAKIEELANSEAFASVLKANPPVVVNKIHEELAEAIASNQVDLFRLKVQLVSMHQKKDWLSSKLGEIVSEIRKNADIGIKETEGLMELATLLYGHFFSPASNVDLFKRFVIMLSTNPARSASELIEQELAFYRFLGEPKEAYPSLYDEVGLVAEKVRGRGVSLDQIYRHIDQKFHYSLDCRSKAFLMLVYASTSPADDFITGTLPLAELLFYRGDSLEKAEFVAPLFIINQKLFEVLFTEYPSVDLLSGPKRRLLEWAKDPNMIMYLVDRLLLRDAPPFDDEQLLPRYATVLTDLPVESISIQSLEGYFREIEALSIDKYDQLIYLKKVLRNQVYSLDTLIILAQIIPERMLGTLSTLAKESLIPIHALNEKEMQLLKQAFAKLLAEDSPFQRIFRLSVHLYKSGLSILIPNDIVDQITILRLHLIPKEIWEIQKLPFEELLSTFDRFSDGKRREIGEALKELPEVVFQHKDFVGVLLSIIQTPREKRECIVAIMGFAILDNQIMTPSPIWDSIPLADLRALVDFLNMLKNDWKVSDKEISQFCTYLNCALKDGTHLIPIILWYKALSKAGVKIDAESLIYFVIDNKLPIPEESKYGLELIMIARLTHLQSTLKLKALYKVTQDLVEGHLFVNGAFINPSIESLTYYYLQKRLSNNKRIPFDPKSVDPSYHLEQIRLEDLVQSRQFIRILALIEREKSISKEHLESFYVGLKAARNRFQTSREALEFLEFFTPHKPVFRTELIAEIDTLLEDVKDVIIRRPRTLVKMMKTVPPELWIEFLNDDLDWDGNGDSFHYLFQAYIEEHPERLDLLKDHLQTTIGLIDSSASIYAAKIVSKCFTDLELTERDPLFLAAENRLIEANSGDVGVKVYRKLVELSRQESDFVPPHKDLGAKKVRFDLAALRQAKRKFAGKVESMVTVDDWDEEVEDLFEWTKHQPAMHSKIDEVLYEMTKETASSGKERFTTLNDLLPGCFESQTIKNMFIRQEGEQPLKQAKFLAIMNYIFSLSDDHKLTAGQTFPVSPRKNHLIKFALSTYTCKTGKNDGIDNFYEGIPAQFKIYGTIEEPKKNLADQPVDGEGYWKQIDLERNREQGALFLFQAIQGVMNQMISNETELMYVLCHLDRNSSLSQKSHFSAFIRNLIGSQIGLNHEVEYDQFIGGILGNIPVDREEGLRQFFNVFTPEKVIHFVRDEVNRQLLEGVKPENLAKEEKGWITFANLESLVGAVEIQDEVEFGESYEVIVSERGILLALLAAGFLAEV